ncbi:hypothetical protein ACFLQ2_05225 [archaeon]
MWILIAVLVLLALTLAGFYLFRNKSTKLHPMETGMAVGGIVGMLVGIGMVEFAGFDYPVPWITWMLGMAGGQLIAHLWKKK